MKKQLLAGASAMALVVGLATTVLAQTANNNETSVVGQTANDVVGAAQNAVDDGAIADGGNAVGEDVTDAAQASASSSATQVDVNEGSDAVATNASTAVDDGSVVGGDGFAIGEDTDDSAFAGTGPAISAGDDGLDEGSVLQDGTSNSAASAEENSASANNSGTAVTSYYDIADEGSSAVVGNGNTTASAEDGGASVAGSGTAVGVDDVDIGGGGGGGESNGHAFAGTGEDATYAFGDGNQVASAHLDSTVTGFVLSLDTRFLINGFVWDEEEGNGKPTGVHTGSIYANSVSNMSGANRVVHNTGIANQGRALAVGANASFSN